MIKQPATRPFDNSDDRTTLFTVMMDECFGHEVLVVRGAISRSTAGTLSVLFVALDNGEPQSVIDLRRVTSIDERGVTILMMEHGRLAGQGRELILAWPTPAVRRVLDRMGMSDIVVIRTTPPVPPTNGTRWTRGAVPERTDPRGPAK